MLNFSDAAVLTGRSKFSRITFSLLLFSFLIQQVVKIHGGMTLDIWQINIVDIKASENISSKDKDSLKKTLR